MSHYDVLGVSPGASAVEIRRAYRQLVRRHHPDLHPDGPARVAAEVRMRELNEAWQVLGDVRRRGDDERPTSPYRAAHPPPPRYAGPAEPAPRPSGPPATPARVSVMAPVGLLGVGVVVAALGMLMGWSALMAFGVIAVVLSGLLFLVAPLLVLTASQRNDRR